MGLKFYDFGSKSTTKGGTIQYEIRNKNVSHIAITQVPMVNMTASIFRVKVELLSKHFNGIIVDEISNTVLEKFSDLEFGHPTQTTNSKKAVINVGSIRLGGGESLIVTITDLSTGTHTVVDYMLLTLYAKDQADFVHVYGKTTADQNILSGVNAVVLDSTSIDPAESFDLNINGSGTIVSAKSLEMINDIQSRNVLTDDTIYSLYYDNEMLPAYFVYEYKGISDFTIFYRRVMANQNRTVFSTIEVLKDYSFTTDKVKKANPETVSALVKSGKMVDSNLIDLKINEFSRITPEYAPLSQDNTSILSTY